MHIWLYTPVCADSTLIGQFFSSVPAKLSSIPIRSMLPILLALIHYGMQRETRYIIHCISFVGNSPLHDLVKINEVGGLTDGKDGIWIELVNLDTESVTLSGWGFVSKKGRHAIDSFTIDLFGLLQQEEGVMDAPVGIRRKISGKSDFIYLVDNNGLLVDSISWRHAKDSIPFGYGDRIPKTTFLH